MKHIDLHKLTFLLFLLLLGLALSGCGGKTIDLTDYIQVGEVQGVNGHGTVKCDWDNEALYAVLTSQKSGGKQSDEEAMDSFFQQLTFLEEAFSHITVTADPCEGLSNGDTVAVTITYDGPKDLDLGCTLKNGKTTFKVEGLPEGQLFDPFAEDAVMVRFEGMSGTGTATVTVESADPLYQAVSYTLSAANGLSNGDEVTLTAQVDAARLTEQGYFVENTEKVFLVSGLGEAFTASDTLSAVDKTRMEGLALPLAEKEAGNWRSYLGVSNLKLEGYYYYAANEPTGHVRDIWYGVNSHSGIVALLVGQCTDGGTCFFAVVFQDCTKGDNGIAFAEDDVVVMSEEDAPSDAAVWLKERWGDDVTVTKLG